MTPSYLPATRYGGPIYSVHGLCKALVARGHDVTVFTTSIDGAGDSPVPLDTPQELDGVKVRYFASRRLRRLVWAPSMLSALHTAVPQVDLVHTHSVFLWPTWAGARAARRCSVPYVLSPRGMLVPDLIRRRGRLQKILWINAIERRNISRAIALHFTAALEQEQFLALGLPYRQGFVVPNGVDSSLIAGDPSPKLVCATQKPYILMLGRVSWKKGFDRAIPALAQVDGVNLVIAGPDDEGYLPAINAMAAAAGITDRVIVLGAVHGADKRHLLNEARLLLLPSYSENFGNVVVEAMQAGCPVIVSRDVGAAALVKQAGAGEVLQNDDSSYIADVIRTMLHNPSAARAMGRVGQSFVAKELGWAPISERMETSYRTVLAKHF